jgi:hypothetical protein
MVSNKNSKDSDNSLFVISIDTDWASQSILDDCVSILNDYKIEATFFITNQIDFFKLKNHELSIHPNFQDFNTQEEVLKNSINMLPIKPKGSRSHKFFYNSPLMSIYEKHGIEYDSNFFIPTNKKIEPFFFKWVDVLEIPVFFCDDAHFMNSSKFDLSDIDLQVNGIKVFLFHPFHIFMNTSKMITYEQHKSNYHNIDYLQQNRNIEQPGTRTFFINLLEFIEKNKIPINTMKEVNDLWRKQRYY